MKMQRAILVLVGIAFAVFGWAQDVVVVEADRMVDPRFDTPINNAVVVIRGDRIEQAGPSAQVRRPPGAKVIDLSGYTILPGLMDCHVHINGRPGDGGDTLKLQENVAKEAIWGVAHAAITLEAGFTTIRNVGPATMPTPRFETSSTRAWCPVRGCGWRRAGSARREGTRISTGGTPI